VSVASKDGLPSSERLRAAIAAAEERLGNTGRVLVRASGTEPLVRVMVEARDEKQMHALAQAVAETIRSATAAV